MNDNVLCMSAIDEDSARWDTTPSLGQHVNEAKRRGFSEQQCARLSGRFTEPQISRARFAQASSKWVCDKALDDYQPKWRINYNYREHISEAKRRGYSELQCGRLSGRFTDTQIAKSNSNPQIIVQSSSNFVDTSDRKVNTCRIAIQTSTPKWDPAHYDWVLNARGQGLSETECARITGRFTNNQILPARTDPVKSLISSLSDETLCHYAIYPNGRYNTPYAERTDHELLVDEARNRGFSEQVCARMKGQFTETQIASVSSTVPHKKASKLAASHVSSKKHNVDNPASSTNLRDLHEYSSQTLCFVAIQDKKPEWKILPGYQTYIKEAKRRRLSEQKCARLTGRFEEVQIANASSTRRKQVKSDIVQEAQRLLINLGHLQGRADGMAGNQTLAAVKAFQESRSLSQTGEINDSLVTSLKQADRERVQTAKVDVAKSLAQLREERRIEEARLAELKIQTKKREKNLAALSQPQPTKNAIPSNINFGEYHALVIGINNYKNLPKLRTAVADAKAIGDVLKTRYGFSVTTLIDPTRAEIFEKLDVLRARLKFSDNLLIYYAGHGWLDKAGNEGYWQPANARNDQQAGWVSNASITTNLRAIKAKHVMVMADSCYSGKLVRGSKAPTRGIELASINAEASSYLQKMARRKTRVAMTSGNLEPVQDGDNKHSPFARAILQALNENERVIDGIRLFNAILQPVVANTDQTPQYAPIRNAGHSDGSFLFVRRK